MKVVINSKIGGYSLSYTAAQWLANNTEAGTIIYHSDWDDWPMLYYYNHHNYYLIGLDPTFMYDYDQELLLEWEEVLKGEKSEGLIEHVEKFNSNYALIGKDKKTMLENFSNTQGFERVYEDDEAVIFTNIR